MSDILNCLLNCLQFIQGFLKIRDKEGTIIPFILNEPQLRLYGVIKELWRQGKPVRIIILKARQMGFSTLVEAVIFWLAVTAFNVECMIVAHTDEATKNLFRMSKRFLEHLPEKIRPMQQASNAQELVFAKPVRQKGKGGGLNSRIRCATAGGEGIGRSYTLRALHISEFAFWPGNKMQTLNGLLQAVPDLPGTLIIIESTAKGFEDFKKLWDKAVDAQSTGREDYIPVFFPWHEMKSYRRTPPPGFKRTAEEEELAKAFSLDDEQLAWRRWCIDNNCGGDIDLFRQEYPASPDEAFIATGHCVFNKPALVIRREQVRKIAWERGVFRFEEGIDGTITRYEWIPDPQGPIRIRLHPEQGVPYVLAGDTAGTGSDDFTGQVLDNRTGEQVAVLQHKFGERMYAQQMYCLGRYYNDALIGIETNYSTYPQMKLEELRYPRLYVREQVDVYTGALQKTYGFRTDSRTRPMIIDALKDVAAYELQNITDYETLGQMLSFVYDENWKAQAEHGEHDDLVMALAIAHHIRHQQTTKTLVPSGTRSKWTADMWEDYKNADKAGRARMIELWGEPENRRGT